MKKIAILSGSTNEELAQKIFEEIEKKDTTELGWSILEREIKVFANGEIGVEILETVAGADVFVIQSSITGKVNDNFVETLLLIDAAKRARADKVYLVQLVLPYQRQDRREKKQQRPKRKPVSAKVILNCFTKAVNVDKIICVRLHAEQIEGFTENDATVEDIEASILFKEYLLQQRLIGPDCEDGDPVIVAPDAGAVKSVTDLLGILGLLNYVIIDKRRRAPGENETMNVIGDCSGRNCIMFDDLVDTGGTAIEAVKALKERGAKKVFLLASHGVFSKNAIERLAESEFEKIVITDSIPNPRVLDFPEKFEVLSLAEILANIIFNIHNPDTFDDILRKNGHIPKIDVSEGVTG